MSNKGADWNRLENAAKIFPPTSNNQDTKVFRFSCQLSDPVKREVLQEALDKTIESFPLFRSVLKHGLFWYYLEKSPIQPLVEPEYRPPCGPLYDSNSRNLLFEVTCYQNRINLEVYHALTDGAGALQFIQTLVCCYMGLLHPELLPQILPAMAVDSSDWEKTEDSFLKYYDPKANKRSPKQKKSCLLHGARVPEGRLLIIEGIMPVQQVTALAKSHQTTLTVLLTSAMLIAFADDIPVRHRKRPVVLSVPVNLRNYFRSETARNFFGVINVGYDFSKGLSCLADVISSVKDSFLNELTPEYLAGRMTALSKAEHNFIARAIPLVFKDLILKSVNFFTRKSSAGCISNLGRVSMPEALSPYIKRFDVFVSTDKLQACVCSYGGLLTVSFTSAFRSTNVQKRFFRILTEAGVDVEIQSNKLEEVD